MAKETLDKGELITLRMSSEPTHETGSKGKESCVLFFLSNRCIIQYLIEYNEKLNVVKHWFERRWLDGKGILGCFTTLFIVVWIGNVQFHHSHKESDHVMIHVRSIDLILRQHMRVHKDELVGYNLANNIRRQIKLGSRLFHSSNRITLGGLLVVSDNEWYCYWPQVALTSRVPVPPSHRQIHESRSPPSTLRAAWVDDPMDHCRKIVDPTSPTP